MAFGFALLSVVLLASGLYTNFRTQKATLFRTVAMKAWLHGALFLAAVSLSLSLGEKPASRIVAGFTA